MAEDGYALHWLLKDLGTGYYSLDTSDVKPVSDVQYNIGGIMFNITDDEESYASSDYTLAATADETIEFFIGGQALTAFRFGDQYKVATIASGTLVDEEQDFILKGQKLQAYRIDLDWYLVI